MTIADLLVAASVAASVAYGAALTQREASLWRTAVKTTAVATLAVLAFVLHHAWPLVAA